MPRMPQKASSQCCCDGGYIDDSIELRLEELQNQLNLKQEKLIAGENITIKGNVISAGTSPSPTPPGPSPTPTPTPTEKTNVYIYAGQDMLGEIIDLQVWQKEEVASTITESGYSYTFDISNTCFPAFLYPVDFKELVSIYQNDLTMFNLLGVFKNKKVTISGKEFYLYALEEETYLEKDKFTFNWK